MSIAVLYAPLANNTDFIFRPVMSATSIREDVFFLAVSLPQDTAALYLEIHKPKKQRSFS